MIVETRAILTGGPHSRLIKNVSLEIKGGILRKMTQNKRPRSRRVAIPGFIQPHVHLCQTGARGTADDLQLLDWLKFRIFPYEDALTPKTLKSSVRRGITELLLSGTTTIMDMGTMRHTEVIGEEILKSGIRAYFGKCLMDENPAFPKLSEPTDKALSETIRLAKTWHKKNSRIRYAFTPRFILSCSDRMMKESFALTQEFSQSRYHTHACESLVEIDAVRARCGTDNLEYLDQIGVVSETSCLAHCVHVNEREIQILKQRRAHVVHCPSSNLKLASGTADIVRFLKEGISVSIASDGAACNNRLDAWTEMRLASLLQKPKHGANAIPAKTAFLLATWGGAKALGWDDEIGCLEEGRAADLVLLDLDTPWMPENLSTEEDYLGAIVYSGRPDNVTDVMVDGKWVVRNRKTMR